MRRLGLVLLCLALPMPAQVAEFSQAYAAAEQQRNEGKVEAFAYRRLYQVALRAFLKIPTDDAAYAAQLPAAGFSAYMAEDFVLSARLFADAIEAAAASDFLVEYRLRSLAKLADLKGAVVCAREYVLAHEAAVSRFLVAEYLPIAAYAGECLRRGDRATGLWCFRALVKATGEHALALANLALAFRYLGDFEQSGALYKRALAAAPEDSILWNDYGIYRKAQGRQGLALQAYRRSIELESAPGNSAAWTNMMFLWRNDKGLVKDSRAAFRKLLAARPHQTLRRRLAIDAILAGTLEGAAAKAVETIGSGVGK